MRSRPSALGYPGQIMWMKARGDMDFSAFVADIPEGLELKDFVPRAFCREIEKFSQRVEVESNEEIELSCGTRAYRAEIAWVERGA